MERMTSKLTRVLVVTLLCAAAATTASSQESPKVDVNALAAKGEAIANEDPLAVELRNQQPDDPARRGFDIGMAAAEGQTLPGPGKDRTCASLPPAEPEGCRIAVLFSVERNKNANFAATGAAIAKADEKVAAARNADTNRRGTIDVFYRLGFDIATGIFGDPALGAKGNTAWGPGSQEIRDSLSPAAQRGFNASVKFHLGQEPPPSTPAPTPRPRTSGDVTSIDNFGKRDAARDKVYADSLKTGTEPTSDEIRCRGYGRTGGSEYVFFTINSRPSPTGETIVTYEMAFTPSVKAAGSRGEGLQPGECAFVDRPISASGPYRIRFDTSANAQLRQQLHGTPVDTSTTAAERFPDAQTIPAYLKDPNHYWSFFGAKPAGNFFLATGNKFWKPGLELVRPDDPIRLKKDTPDVFSPKKPE